MSTKLQMALQSVRQLRNYVSKLTEQELYECLKTESETLRRKNIFTILVNRLADLNRRTFISNLKETFNGSRRIRSNEQG